MPPKTSFVYSLLRRLRRTPPDLLAHSGPLEPPLSAAEQEQIVQAALLPNPRRAIDATLEHLYPCKEQNGFTCILHLNDIEDDLLHTIVRKALSAGSAIRMVRPDGSGSYQVHGDFYKLLARLRSAVAVQVDLTSAVLTNGLHGRSGPAKIVAPTEPDIISALGDVARELSDFVILARNADGHADYIQIGAGPAPFRVECRVWLNDTFAEHFHITDPQSPEGFADINTVASVMLHWLATGGRLPQYVTIRNITDELRLIEHDQSDAD